MKRSLSAPLLLLVLLLVVVAGPPAEAAISCSDVVKQLRPCVSYLVNGSGKPPAACCTGASALASAASTPADKKAACECIQSTAKNVKLKEGLAKDLPNNCGITLPFEISSNFDCSTVG